MGTEQILPNVYRIGMGYVSAYLIAADDVTIIDSGLPKRRDRILLAVQEAGRKPEDVKHIALTHHHVDHTGSLAALLAAQTRLRTSTRSTPLLSAVRSRLQVRIRRSSPVASSAP